MKRDADSESTENSAVMQRQLYRDLDVRGRRHFAKCPECWTMNNVRDDKGVCFACHIRRSVKK